MSLLTKAYWEGLKNKQRKLKEKIQKDHWRLHYHQMPATGWLNDPNGACQFKGTYHLYHQYVPENPEGGIPHWAHKTSKDMVHFTEEEIFLSPEHSYEKDGVYSGSAFVKDDEIHYFYTGNVKNSGGYDYIFNGREQNTVHAVSKDGFSLELQEVVIKHEDYPKEYTDHIRDPKIFAKNGLYYMVLGARRKDHYGELLLYRSKDLYTWEFHGILLEKKEDMGYMWECPDFFDLNGKSVVLFSPQGLNKKLHQFQNVYQTGFYIGETDWDKIEFQPEASFKELDYGFDFYAPQTFEDESGRRILWGWMGLGDTNAEYVNPTVNHGWQHALTLPRELTIEQGCLKQRPLPEYQMIRKEENRIEANISGEYRNVELTCEVSELLIYFDEVEDGFEIHLRQDTVIRYDKGILSITHGVSGAGRSFRTVKIDKLEQLHIFSDTSSLEIFINDGDYVMSSRVYPDKGKNQVRFRGHAQLRVNKWEIAKTVID
ncbi:glycoside hydrolase family 32 protein [Amphibacillus sp. Q70]|uniref:glycoside hydrolase family 32 protein n=1 Tax=Amphibacillus sp. Q70 TaxID=3453416 RepID=UPI003F867D9D